MGFGWGKQRNNETTLNRRTDNRLCVSPGRTVAILDTALIWWRAGTQKSIISPAWTDNRFFVLRMFGSHFTHAQIRGVSSRALWLPPCLHFFARTDDNYGTEISSFFYHFCIFQLYTLLEPATSSTIWHGMFSYFFRSVCSTGSGRQASPHGCG